MKDAVKILLFTGVHFAATLGAPQFFSTAGLVTLFWPATGFALAAVLAGGYRYAWATLFSCTLAVILDHEKGMAQVVFGAANVLEIFIAPYLLSRLARIDISFDKATDYLKFIVYAGVLLPIPAALCAATAIKLLTVSQQPFWLPALEWWMSDSLGILSLTPLLLIWRRLPPAGWFSRSRVLEGTIGLALTTVACYLFLGASEANGSAYPRAYLFFIGVAWAATRFGRHATLLITTLVIIFAITWARSNGSISDGRTINFVNIWLFLVTLSTVGMALATTFNERRTNIQRMSELLEAQRREEIHRREADAALARSNVDFQRLVETAAEGIWTIDAGGKTTFMNARMAEMLGYTPEELLGKTMFELMPAENHGEGSERLARRKSGVAEEHETMLIHKNGSLIRTFMSTNAIKDNSGSVVGALAMVTDISARTKAETALRENEDRYRKIVEVISDAVMVHQSGIILYGNPAAAELLGFEKAESLIGLNAFSFMHPDDQAKIIARAQQLLQNPSDAYLPKIHQRIVRPDGSIVTIESVTTNVHFNGRPAMLVIAREITPDIV